MMRALVAGATGYLGGHLVGELKQRGVWVRALCRKPEQRKALKAIADDTWLGEVTAPRTLSGITAGIDTLFSTIGITRQKDGLTYEEVDHQGNLNILREAIRGDVERFLYVSVLHGRRLRQLRIVDAKERFVDALREAPIRSCVMRPTGFFSDMGEFLTMARKGAVLVFGDGSGRMNPISGRDLAKVCVDGLLSGENDIEAGGPQIYTQDEVAALAFAALGKPRRVVRVPRWMAKAGGKLLRLTTPLSVYGPMELFLTLATEDVVAPPYGSDQLDDYFRSLAQS